MGALTGHWIGDGLVLMFSIAAVFYLYMTRKFNYWKKRGVLEFKPVPFLGNFGECLFFRKSALDFIKDYYNNSKGLKYMGFYILDQPFLMLRDPELIKHILIKDFNYFHDRYTSTGKKDILGNANLFTIKNPAWRFLRGKLTPFFTSGKMKKMFELMLAVNKDLDTYLESLDIDSKGREMEMKELCAMYTTDLIGVTAYGLRVNSLNNPDAEFRACGRQIFNFNWRRGMELACTFFAPKIVDLFGFKFFSKESTEFLRRAFWDTIDERVKSGVKRNDLIDLLIDLREQTKNGENKEFRFDGDNLVAQAAIFFTGGFETSSSAMSFSLYELALQPEIQRKLRVEILEALEDKNGELTYDMVANLPYLNMVVSETLRKYPPLPFLDRETNMDYKLPGTDLIVEKGTPVYIPLQGLHYDPQYFPDPEKFDPERFSEENKKNIPPCVYMPFGEGPHICIGLRFGLLQTKLGLIKILSKYEISACDKTNVPIVFNKKALVIAAEGGITLKIKKLMKVPG
ncbi:cytochrome P450 6k1 [Cephus cinctus]|uniref:Cytochrome P450 6k1 n=1 Tax=Cephus cinctus TaxID=211228 RepID=A0AAJ7C2D8_CEPCN|nr:cytochrome P450 6k1 [Cephus cinctus]